MAVRLDENDDMYFLAPFGFEDLDHHILRITPQVKVQDP